MPHASIVAPALATVLAVLLAAPAHASDAAASQDGEAPRWSFRGGGDYYYLPESGDYSIWIASAKRGLLHLEARYNYEDLHTVSTFVGLNVGFGDELRLELTPMAGVIVGRTNGLAPGVELALSYWKLALYSEVEYVFDLAGMGDTFFHSWTELSLWPVEWARVGAVFDRTRLIETAFDVQRGFLLGATYRSVSATAHFLNPASKDAYFVFSLSVEL